MRSARSRAPRNGRSGSPPSRSRSSPPGLPRPDSPGTRCLSSLTCSPPSWTAATPPSPTAWNKRSAARHATSPTTPAKPRRPASGAPDDDQAQAGMPCGAVQAAGQGLTRDCLADGGDDLGGPAGQGLVGGGVVGAAVDEAGRVVVQDGGGELVDPLLDGAADPAAVLPAGGRERFGGDAAAEVVDADDIRRVPARRDRGGVDAGARLAVELAQPVRT